MTVEVSTPEEIERYKIDNEKEIERILASVMAEKALVTVYGDDKEDFLVTSLVAVDLPGRAIYIGAGQDVAVNEALIASRKVSFNTAQDRVKVLFSTGGLTMATLSGEPVLRADLPRELLRFQRREYFRLATSLTNPVKCVIDVGSHTLDTTVLDISIGGVGVLAYTDKVKLRKGETFHGCRLTLPDVGSYLVSLEVRAIYEPTMKNGVLSRRMGCQFIDLAPSVETDLQRYIIRVERARRASKL